MMLSGSYTDLYQLSMGQVYYLSGNYKKTATFDYFFRSLPFAGGYAIFAGLEVLLNVVENLSFTSADCEFLKKHNFDNTYIKYLKNFKFTGSIWAFREGEVVFGYEPIIKVSGNLLEVQLIETLLLNIINFQTLIATKASRIRLVAKDRQLIEFGMRRAQGLGSLYASRAAIIGGFDATSNVAAAACFELQPSGTMAHSFIQSYDSELAAFLDFAKFYPNNITLLVDTYNTLDSGLPNAIKCAKELQARGKKLHAIRIDSGDLAYLATQCRDRLDKAGFHAVKIAVSNQLDEDVIKSLLEQNAPIDCFGVGTALAVGKDDAALNGVFKLAVAADKPRLKLSDSFEKITLPGDKQVYRVWDGNNMLGFDVICLSEEKNNFGKIFHPFDSNLSKNITTFKLEPLQKIVLADGLRVTSRVDIKSIKSYVAERITALPREFKRFNNPHVYKVGLSAKLKSQRDDLKEILLEQFAS